eukprot:15366003-Ditylum_brightwellii.AAC.2
MCVHTGTTVNKLQKMTKDGKHVKWQNGVQSHQNGKPLSVLDPQIKGYDPVEFYQWEMCV